MAEDTSVVVDEEEPFFPNLVCVAEQDFNGQEKGDLTFVQGEILTIVRQAEMAYWYVARNAAGVTGLVPKTYLLPLHQVTVNHANNIGPNVDPPFDPLSLMSWSGTDFLEVQGTVDEDLLRAQRREAERRHPPGTLVIATSQFVAQSNEDMSFDIYEEMTLLKPMESCILPLGEGLVVHPSTGGGASRASFCWGRGYLGGSTRPVLVLGTESSAPSEMGVIPITHVKLVDMSDDEDDDGNYKVPKAHTQDRLYESREEFIQASGWYSYIGLPPTKEALLHVLAKKINLPYEDFMITTQAVYMLHYLDHEKVYVGKAEVLHKELSLHFDCFGKPRGQIRGIDDELCHHTDAAGWSIMVWPLLEDQVLEVEWNKKIIEQGSLQSSEEVGMNELEFTSMDNWDKFGKWFWPN
eukprot:Em0022g186a